MKLKIISIAAIIIGFTIETVIFPGKQFGNGIAAIGIILFVYNHLAKRQGPKL
ncbi:MAG: hypothetical protein ACJ0RU_04945 [Candidatus Rariloculaceae bacterium]